MMQAIRALSEIGAEILEPEPAIFCVEPAGSKLYVSRQSNIFIFIISLTVLTYV